MVLPVDFQAISGAQELFDWFGYWPKFHDAEVQRFHLDASEPSLLVIRTWEMTDRVDARGFYELTKKVLVELTLRKIENVQLVDLWEHSILFDLVIAKTERGFRLDISSSYGLTGVIEAGHVGIRITPEG